MTNPSINQKLRDVLHQSREYVRYFAELGIETAASAAIAESETDEYRGHSVGARPKSNQLSPKQQLTTKRSAPLARDTIEARVIAGDESPNFLFGNSSLPRPSI